MGILFSECCALPRQPPPSLPLCVHVRTQQDGSSPRAQMLSVNTEIPERKQGFTASCTHTASADKDQEPGEDNLLHINTDLPVPFMSRWFCFLAQDGLGSERANYRQISQAARQPRVPRVGPLSACHHQEVNSYWLLNKWLQCVGVRGLPSTTFSQPWQACIDRAVTH